MGKSFFNLTRKESPKNSCKSSESSTSSSPQSPISNSCSVLRIRNSDDLRMVFDKYDTDGDGKISSSELESMCQCLENLGSSEDVESMMKTADLDGDGYISFEEYMSVNTMDADSSACMEDLRTAFTVYDRDNNGLITVDELHHVLRMMGEKKTLADCKRMIDGIDQNGDGAVDFEEFMQMMTRSSA